MKQKISLLLVCLLALLCPLNSLAARDYTLPEKMRQQLQLSSLNGSAKLLVEGEGDWVKAMEPFADQLINFYYTEDGKAMGIELYAKPDEESKAGRTLVYSDGTDVYLKSDLLIDTVLKLPVRGDWLSTLTQAAESENPSFYSIVLAAMRGDDDWSDATAGLRSSLEFWLDNYASAPETAVVNGETRMSISYTLPAADMKTELKALLPQLFADAVLTEKLRAVMSEEQAAVYLNPGLQWYYERLIDGIEMDAPVTMRRSFNTLGATRETELLLPLKNFGDWTELSVVSDDAGTTYALRSELEHLELRLVDVNSAENNSHYSGSLLWERPEQQAWDFAFDIVSLRTVTTDEEKVDHDITTWTIKLEPTANAASHNALIFDPAQIRIRLHYHSKGSITSSTTLDITWDASLPGGHTNGAMKLRTEAPISIERIDSAAANDLSTVSTEKRQEYLNDWLTNARLLLTQLKQPLPEEDATEANEDNASAEVETVPELLVPVDNAPADEGAAESGEDEDEAASTIEVPTQSHEATEGLHIPLTSTQAAEQAEETAFAEAAQPANEEETETAPAAAETPAVSPIVIEEEVMLDDDAEGV